MTQGKRKKSQTEVLKKQNSAVSVKKKNTLSVQAEGPEGLTPIKAGTHTKGLLDLENTIQKDIQVDDASLEKMVNQSLDSAVVDLFTSEKKLSKKEKIQTKEIQENSHSSGEAFVLTLSNHLKIAENKIKELENENEKLCLDNEKLMVAGEALKEAVDKFSSENKNLKSDSREERLSWANQKNDFENLVEGKILEIKNLKTKISALEKHLSRDIRKIRTRERELENRLELKQNEMESIIREKDITLLKFKQELDLLREKAESDRQNHHLWMEKNVQNKERIEKAVQSLRLSLQLLESSPPPEDEFILEEKSELFEKSAENSLPQKEEPLKETSSAPIEGGSNDLQKENQEALESVEEDAG